MQLPLTALDEVSHMVSCHCPVMCHVTVISEHQNRNVWWHFG